MTDPRLIATRLALEDLFKTPEYRIWALKPGNQIDASKIARNFAGTPTTTCGTLYGKAVQKLVRANPKPSTPIPPPAIDPVWQLDAAFTSGGLSNFNGSPRDTALATGWKAVYIELLNTTYGAANLAEMVRPPWNPWMKIGWGTYGQGTDPEQDGRNAAAICKANPALKGWKANGETWAEGNESWKTQAFLDGWREGGAPVPLGWSVLSSDTANFARSYAYEVALSALASDIDCQVYGATDAGYTVGACLGMLSKVGNPPGSDPVPVNRTTMTFDVNGNGDGPFTDYLTWPGPRRLWQPDKATVATFNALKR